MASSTRGAAVSEDGDPAYGRPTARISRAGSDSGLPPSTAGRAPCGRFCRICLGAMVGTARAARRGLGAPRRPHPGLARAHRGRPDASEPVASRPICRPQRDRRWIPSPTGITGTFLVMPTGAARRAGQSRWSSSDRGLVALRCRPPVNLSAQAASESVTGRAQRTVSAMGGRRLESILGGRTVGIPARRRQRSPARVDSPSGGTAAGPGAGRAWPVPA